MKVLVTGATGFLGSYLVKALLRTGHEVVILKRSFSDTWRIDDVIKQLDYYDIDKYSVDAPFRSHGKLDAIVHTATCYGRKGESLKEIIETNMLFPLKLLETATLFDVDTFLNTDTILPKYLNAYSLSKKQFMEWGRQISFKEKMRFINIQLEHMYGPNDDEYKFTQYIIKNCVDNVPELKLTLGEQKRDFIYINDVIEAYLVLIQARSEKTYQNFELGSGQAISIRKFVEMVHSLTNSQTVLKFGALPYREGEVMNSKADIIPLKKIGWAPKVSLAEGITVCLPGGVAK